MKKTFFFFLFSFFSLYGLGQGLSVVELNCENLFDCRHDSLKQDTEFLPNGSHRWTPTRYWQHQNNIGKTILSCSESLESQEPSGLPDLVCLCEVENDSTVFDLTKRSCLRNAGYEYLMTNSPDIRGIDVALLYNPYTFRPERHYSLRVQPLPGMRPTRDILYVEGEVASGNRLHVFVVHAPSMTGGEFQTRKNRRQVFERLMLSVDSILSKDINANILVAGDFNDYHPQLPAVLTDVSIGAKGSHGALGTYKYQGEWGSLDHVFVSEALVSKVEMCIVNDSEFLLEEDKEYGGVRPHRNYKGPVYQKGFSDHLPLVVRIGDLRVKEKKVAEKFGSFKKK